MTDLPGGGAEPDRDHDLIHLADALEALPEAVAVFDDEDRFVLWNGKFEDFFGGEGAALRRGLRFEDHLRHSLACGRIPAAAGREEAWLAERLKQFHLAEGGYDHQLADGRWVRAQDRRLPHGGRIGIRTDITQLVGSDQSSRVLFEANPTPMFLLDRQSLQMVAVNDAALEFYGYSREQFLGLTLRDIRPERQPGEIEQIIDHLHEPEIAAQPRIHLASSGEERVVRVKGRVIDYLGRPTVLAAIFDTTGQDKVEEEARRSRQFLRDVFDHIPTAVFVKDMHDGGRYVLRNKASAVVFGRPSDILIGKSDREVLGADRVGLIEQRDRELSELGVAETVDDDRIVEPDGSTRLIRVRKVGFSETAPGRYRYVLGIAEDVTAQRASEARIAFKAHHDALTELPNRFLFQDRLETALARLPGTSQLLAVLLIDLDGFKSVNDTWGHGIGDELLKAVGDRMRTSLRPSDTVARLGGDEFAVLQAPIDQLGEAAWLASRLVSQLSAPFHVAGRELRISASIGISLAPLGSTQPSGLLSQADAALYQSKREGRNRFRFADPTPEAGDRQRRSSASQG